MEPDKALAYYSQARQALLNALRSIPPAELSDMLVEGDWSAKDVLGHIAAWDETLIEPLRQHAAGAPFVVEIVTDGQAWNAAQAASRHDLSLADILAELEATHAALLESAGRLSAEQLQVEYPTPWGGRMGIAKMLGGLGGHSNEHLEAIEKHFHAEAHN